MESTLRLHYGATPTMPRHIPSTRVTKLHFSSSHSSLSLHKVYIGSTRRPLGNVFRPVIRAIERSSIPSTKNKAGNKIARGTMGLSLVLACALGFIGCSGRMTPKAIAVFNAAQTTSTTETSVITDMGDALKPLLRMSASLVSSKGMSLPKETADNLKDALQRIWTAEDAFNKLDKALKLKDNSRFKYELEMALVEVLICQGKYEEALTYDCLKKKVKGGPSDYRIPLYKAVIHTMLNNKSEARENWEKLEEVFVFAARPDEF